MKLKDLENASNIENYYPYIVNKVMEHIINLKEHKIKMSIFDMICDFCIKNDIDSEIVGDAIRDNVMFTDYIKLDCKINKIIVEHNDNNYDTTEW